MRAARDAPRRALDDRAPERRGWPRRDFPGDGQCARGDGGARLSGRRPAPRDGASARCEKLLVVQDRQRLLPALRLAGVGYGAGALAMQEAGSTARCRLPSARSTGSRASSCSTSPATGRLSGRALPGGGWAFQFGNDYYPDLDDTAVIVWAHAAARAIPRRYAERDGARARLAGRHAEQQRRLRRVRRRQHALLPELDSLRRSRRAAGSADQRCHGARGHGAGAGDRPQDAAALERAIAYLRAEQEAGRLLVRPLGHQLHLRHLVGADRLRAGGHAGRTMRRCGAPCGWLIESPERRMAAGARATTATLQAARASGTSRAASTPYQTAWALLGLLAAGEAASDAVRARHRVPATAAERRPVERSELHRARFPARVLPQVPRLLRLFPALGAGALPQSRLRREPLIDSDAARRGVVCALRTPRRDTWAARHLRGRGRSRCSADGTLLVVSGMGWRRGGRGARAL